MKLFKKIGQMLPLKKLAENKIFELLSPEKFISVLKNPQKNPQETFLVVGILTALFLIILIFVVILALLASARRKKRITKK